MINVNPSKLIIIIGLILVVAIGCSDKSTNSDPPQNTPAELVGIWEWNATTENGNPITSFADLSFTDTSTSQELEFMIGGFWETREYYQGIGPVYIRSGTCYDDDSLYITCTIDNGTPESSEPFGASWMVVANILTMSTSFIVATNPPMRLKL